MRESGEEMGRCYAVRINSGRFGVEWQKTKAVLEAGDLDVTVVRPEGEGKVEGAAGKKRGRLPVMGEKAPAGIDASGRKPWARTKAQGPLDKQSRGVKRKAVGDLDEDGDHEREDTKGTEKA